MTEDRTFFPWVSALITGLLPALPHLYKCQSKVHCFTPRTVPFKEGENSVVFIVGWQNTVVQKLWISGYPELFFFFPFSYLRRAVYADITHAHYHISLTVSGIGALIPNILIAAGSYILLSLREQDGAVKQSAGVWVQNFSVRRFTHQVDNGPETLH